MSKVQGLIPDELDKEQVALYRAIVEGPRNESPFRLLNEDGSLAGPFDLMLRAPAIGLRLSALGEALRYESRLDPELREIAILVVAASRQSAYEWHAHQRVAMTLGVSHQAIESIRAGNHSDLSPQQLVVCSVVDNLLRHETLNESLWHSAVRQLGIPGLVELIVLVGYYDTLATLLREFEIGEPSGEDPVFDRRMPDTA